MITAPNVKDPRDWDFKFGDKREMIEKQNALNQWRYDFSEQLKTMCNELNIEFQFVAESRIDITKKAGQVATDRQHVDQQKQAIDNAKTHVDQQKQAIDNAKTHVDQQKQAIDTTAGQVSQNAQQVADDRQAAADAAQAAGESAGQAEQSRQAAHDLYGDLEAVNTAKTQSQQAATTASEQRALAVTARQGAEQALAQALLAAADANAEVDAAIAALVDSSPDALNTLNELAAALGDDPNFATTVNNALADKLPKSHLTAGDPHSQYLQKTGGTLSGDITIDKPSTRHLWFREGGLPRGLVYSPQFSASSGLRLNSYAASGKATTALALTDSGDIEALVGRFKGDGSGLTNVNAKSLDGVNISTATDIAEGKSGNRLDADSFHTNGLGFGQAFYEGSRIDFNTSAYIGTGKAGGQQPSTVYIQDPRDETGTPLARVNGTYSGLRAQATTAADVGAPPTSRTITAGTGLTGGGNLTTNRTISVDSTVMRNNSPQTISKAPNGLGSDSYHLELRSPDTPEVSGEISMRFHHASNFYYQIRARNSGGVSGFRLTGGDNDNLVQLQALLDASNLTSGTVPIARISSTSSRTSNSSTALLHAKAMNDHRTSGDHDSRYVLQSGYNAFNPAGTYSGLRAQGTTKADVGLSNIPNSTTASRTSASTGSLLQAKAMNDHRKSGDHDGRYYTKGQVDNLVDANTVPTDLNVAGSYAIMLDETGVVTRIGTIRQAGALRYVRVSFGGDGSSSGRDPAPTGAWRLMSWDTQASTSNTSQSLLGNQGLWVKI